MNTKLKAALKMSTLSPDGKVTTGQNIITSMQAVPNFFPPASMPLPFTSMTACITNLHNAIIATGSGSAGSISNMHEKERVVLSIFNVVRAYVEMQANNTTDPQTIIEAAGMVAVKNSGGQQCIRINDYCFRQWRNASVCSSWYWRISICLSIQ